MIKQDLRWWLPLTLLAVMTSAGWYQWLLHHPQGHHLTGDYIDIIAETVQVKRFDEQGQLMQVLTSPRVEHYAISQTLHFNHPKAIIFPTQPGRSIWQMTAGMGVLSSHKDQLDLSQGVDIQELIVNGKRLQTEKLTWFPANKTAVTDQLVTATEPGAVITAVGARFEQIPGVVYLLSQVKLNYQPAASEKR